MALRYTWTWYVELGGEVRQERANRAPARTATFVTVSIDLIMQARTLVTALVLMNVDI